MVSVIITCKNDVVVKYEDAREIVIYDMDSKKIVLRREKPPRPELLEDIVEEYDVCAMLTASIEPETEEVFATMGVKVVLVKQSNIEEVINEIFI